MSKKMLEQHDSGEMSWCKRTTPGTRAGSWEGLWGKECSEGAPREGQGQNGTCEPHSAKSLITDGSG